MFLHRVAGEKNLIMDASIQTILVSLTSVVCKMTEHIVCSLLYRTQVSTICSTNCNMDFETEDYVKLIEFVDDKVNNMQDGL